MQQPESPDKFRGDPAKQQHKWIEVTAASCGCFQFHGQASFRSELPAKHPFHTTTFSSHPHMITTFWAPIGPPCSRPILTYPIQPNLHSLTRSHSIPIVLCCGALIHRSHKESYCVCISQQRPPRKCMYYVFERGRVQKQLPGRILLEPSASSPVPMRWVHLKEKRTKGSGGCFWTGELLHLVFYLTMCFFLRVCDLELMSAGGLDLYRLNEVIQLVYKQQLRFVIGHKQARLFGPRKNN